MSEIGGEDRRPIKAGEKSRLKDAKKGIALRVIPCFSCQVLLRIFTSEVFNGAMQKMMSQLILFAAVHCSAVWAS